MRATIPQAPVAGPGRQKIYYWKCDRPAAFYGTQAARETAALEPHLRAVLESDYPRSRIELRDGGGQGNHLTWIAEIDSQPFFVRVENGPERDDHLEVETDIMRRVRDCGVPTPYIHSVDVERTRVPFAWQLMELIPARDLNHAHKAGQLDSARAAHEIGAAVARWQSVPVGGFGHFDPLELRRFGHLQGYYQEYADYFLLNWHRHLAFLTHHHFLAAAEAEAIRLAVEAARDLLSLTPGCLVHKDLAFWNILGDQQRITAYIDWDDAVAADEMDDLSLLGCFHDGPVITRALQGYQSVKPLPEQYGARFWLHLLRNMIVKSVIRQGAGYFQRTDGFFLLGNGMSGADLIQQTRSRLFRVLEGLRSQETPHAL